MKFPWSKKTKPVPEEAPVVPPAPPNVSLNENASQALGSLTPRERDVFKGLMRGLKLQSIADELGIKYSTVNSHCKGIYKKLSVNTRAELILRYNHTIDG